LRLSGSAKPPRPLRPARNQPDENSPDCYSELQRPLTLDAFPNGAILVTGESRCDAGYGEEELSDLYRPVVESFPPGGGKSTVRTLPFDRIDWVLSQSDGTLWILGAVLKEPDDPETATKHLVFVDHERIIPIEARLGAARALITGPGAPGDDRAEAKSAAPLPRSVWLLDDKSLRPALEGPKSIALPEGCAPVDAWFEGKYAWLECEEGVFTNDPDQAPFDIPKNDDQCDALQPRPETDVAGLFDPTRSSSSCGRREVEHQAPGDPDSFGY
jgi:hypothetical protein